MEKLIDAQQMHIKYPDSFQVPSKYQLDNIEPGDVVKVANNGERFWVVIKKVDGEQLEGKVNNKLLSDELKLNDTIQFEKRNVYEIW